MVENTDVHMTDADAAAAAAAAAAMAAAAVSAAAAANGAGGSTGTQDESNQSGSVDAVAQRFQSLAVGLSAAEQEALLAAAERRKAQLAEEAEKAAAQEECRALQARMDAIRARFGLPADEVVSTSNVNDVALVGLLQRLLQQETRRPVHASDEGNAGSGGSKASLAKSMNRPKVWEGSGGGSRRAAVFLREIKQWAELHGGKGEDILQSYLGDRVKGLFLQQMDAWAADGIDATWDRMCSAFCTIVGETEAEEKAKSLDDFTGFKVRQKKHQSLGEYKVYFQNELLRAGGGLPEAWAVRFFINGLGSRELKAACQPELTAGKIGTVDEAFICAKGQEAKLLTAGIQPFSATQHNGSASGTLASVQGTRNGGSHQGQQGNRHGKRTREPGSGSKAPPRKLPSWVHRNAQGYLVDNEGHFVCSICYGTRGDPKATEQGHLCTKNFHKLPAAPRK